MKKRERIDTSIAAFHSLDKDQVSETKRLIVEALTLMGKGTSEQIATHLKKDHDVIWKRCSDLKNDGIIYASDEKALTKKNRFARQWKLVTPNTTPEKKTERVMGGKTVADFSKQLIQNKLF